MSSLSKLEEKGLKVVSALDKVYKKFAAVVGVTLNNIENLLKFMEREYNISARGMHMETVMSAWLREKHPTWRTLLEVLKKLNFEELSQDIEEYLSTSSSEFECL